MTRSLLLLTQGKGAEGQEGIRNRTNPFAFLPSCIAAIGLYAVIGYNVTQRLHEIGVRIASGAQTPPGDVVRLVVGQGLGFAVAGALLGRGRILAAKWVQPLLFQQSVRDPFVLLTVGGIPVMVAIAASSVPAFRATRAVRITHWAPNSTRRSRRLRKSI